MKDSYHHDCLLERLVNDQVVAEFRHDEPADLRVARSRLADAPSKLRMLGKKIGGVEDGLPDALRRFRIISGNVLENLVQIAPGS